jgi:hypothetical protein
MNAERPTTEVAALETGGSWAISGIVDFGDLAIGDPAGEFTRRYEYGEAFFRRVFAHYDMPLSDVEAFSRVVSFRWRLMAAGEVDYGLQTGNAAYIAEGRAQLRARMAVSS